MKVVYLVEKRPYLTDEESVDHWPTTHTEPTVNMPGLQSYPINHASALQLGSHPLAGYAMHHFDSYDDTNRAWETTEGRATAADCDAFVASARPLIGDEIIVLRNDQKVVVP